MLTGPLRVWLIEYPNNSHRLPWDRMYFGYSNGKPSWVHGGHNALACARRLDAERLLDALTLHYRNVPQSGVLDGFFVHGDHPTLSEFYLVEGREPIPAHEFDGVMEKLEL